MAWTGSYSRRTSLTAAALACARAVQAAAGAGPDPAAVQAAARYVESHVRNGDLVEVTGWPGLSKRGAFSCFATHVVVLRSFPEARVKHFFGGGAAEVATAGGNQQYT